MRKPPAPERPCLVQLPSLDIAGTEGEITIVKHCDQLNQFIRGMRKIGVHLGDCIGACLDGLPKTAQIGGPQARFFRADVQTHPARIL